MKKKLYAEVKVKKQLPHMSVKYLLKPFTLQQLYHICVAGVCSHGLRPLPVRLLLPPGASHGLQAHNLAPVGPPHATLLLGPAALSRAVLLLAPRPWLRSLTKLALWPWLGPRGELALLAVAATMRAASLERSGATQSAAVADSACEMFLQLCKSRFDAGGWSSVSISSGSPRLHLRWQDSDLFRSQSGGEIEKVYAHLFLSDINSCCTS
jgi:hypothetical protein